MKEKFSTTNSAKPIYIYSRKKDNRKVEDNGRLFWGGNLFGQFDKI